MYAYVYTCIVKFIHIDIYTDKVTDKVIGTHIKI